MDWISEIVFRPQTLVIIAAVVAFNLHDAWLRRRYYHGKPIMGEAEWREIAIDPWNMTGAILITLFALLLAGGFVAVSVFADGRLTRLETLWGMLISCVFLVYSIVEWQGIVATKRHSIRHSYDSISYRTKAAAERAKRSIADIVHYEERLWRPTKIHFKDGAIRMSSHAWGASALRDQITRMIEERT